MSRIISHLELYRSRCRLKIPLVSKVDRLELFDISDLTASDAQTLVLKTDSVIPVERCGSLWESLYKPMPDQEVIIPCYPPISDPIKLPPPWKDIKLDRHYRPKGQLLQNDFSNLQPTVVFIPIDLSHQENVKEPYPKRDKLQWTQNRRNVHTSKGLNRAETIKELRNLVRI